MKTLSIIGSGQVGCVLGKIFSEAKIFKIQSLFSRSHERALDAQKFIGEGDPISHLEECRSSDFYMLTVRDDGIEETACALAKLPQVMPSQIAFHCSGALSSELLAPLAEKGLYVASLYPAKHFISREEALNTFAGTTVILEGDKMACRSLAELLEHLPIKIREFVKERKQLFHAALVMASPLLVALLNMSTEILKEEGMDDLQFLQPIVFETIQAFFNRGAVAALGGPFARGDEGVIYKEINALEGQNLPAALTYVLLAREAMGLIKNSGQLIDKKFLEVFRKYDNRASVNNHEPLYRGI